MTDDSPLPPTVNAAIAAGFKRFEWLAPRIQALVRAQDTAESTVLSQKSAVCEDGHTGPCSITNYPDGSRKLCYCTQARQCNDCVFEIADG